MHLVSIANLAEIFDANRSYVYHSPFDFYGTQNPRNNHQGWQFPCYRLNRLISSPPGLVMATPKKSLAQKTGWTKTLWRKKRGTLVPNTWKRRALAIAMNSDNKHCSWTLKWNPENISQKRNTQKKQKCVWYAVDLSKTVRVRRCHFSNIQQNATRF